MATNKFLSMLGLAKRAGAVMTGTDLVTKALPSGKIRLVIYAENSSPNTEKKITDKCKFYGVQCIKCPYDAGTLSHSVGKESDVCAFGISDENFSKELISLMARETI